MQQPDDRGVTHGVPEEEVLHRRGTDHPQQGNRQKESAEPGRLPGVAVSDVVTQDALSLILEHLHRVQVCQTDCLWKCSELVTVIERDKKHLKNGS